MEFDRRSLRSTSQTSLHSTYRSQGRLNGNSQRISGVHTQRPPSRPVNRNTAVLRYPGPLESMLKTTTETGDIGLFTIKPNVPSATYHPPPRSRPGISDVNLLQASRSRFHEGRLYPDDRRLLPSSYRDTTSEILSLYGSDVNLSRAYTPSNDDGRRSYSLTTCSSQPLPSQKSSGTVLSQASSTPMQRPRSPFPYPTRLKRPGARPASPAMTENGTIDYSRMVEIDRAPHQKKMNPPYNAIQYHTTRRPPPLSLRAEVNRSSSSLPCRAQAGTYYTSAMPYRAFTPNSSYVGMPKSFDRPRRASHAQSLRSASVTSIVDMYRRPTTAASYDGPLHHTASFYYDYTEEFENETMAPVAPAPPLCPIPQRVASANRPMILMAEENGDLRNSTSSEKDSSSSVSMENSSLSPPREEFATISNASPEVELRTDHLANTNGSGPLRFRSNPGDGTTESVITVQERPQQNRLMSNQMNRSLDLSSINKDHTECSVGCLKKSMSDGANVPSKMLEPRPDTLDNHLKQHDVLCYPVQPTSNAAREAERLEPLSASQDGAAISSVPDTTNQSKVTNGIEHSIDTILRPEAKDPEEVQTKEPAQAVEDGDKPFLRRHRRNPAAARISTSGIRNPPNPTALPPTGGDNAMIISPEPISPARQLRVKQSIPQLMKALPPLPAEAYEDSSEIQSSSSIEGEGADAVDHEEIPVEQAPPTKDARGSPPKFKLRLRHSQTSTSTSEVGNSEGNEMGSEAQTGRTSPSQRKLKIKASRNHAESVHNPAQGTVLRSSALKQCNSLADLQSCAQKDIFNSPCQLESVFSGLDPESELESSSVRAASRETLRLGISSRKKEPKAPAPNHAAPANATSIPRKGDPRHCQSLGSGLSKEDERKPRKKHSFLRLRSDKVRKETRCDATVLPFGITDGSVAFRNRPIAKCKEPRAEMTSSLTAERRSGRVRRWARGAKKAIRSYMRKTVHRSRN